MTAPAQRCKVYRSPIAGRSDWLILPENVDIHDVPAIFNDFHHAEWWKTIELDPDKKYVGLDVNEALGDIAAKGYHIVTTKIDTIEEWPGDTP